MAKGGDEWFASANRARGGKWISAGHTLMNVSGNPDTIFNGSYSAGQCNLACFPSYYPPTIPRKFHKLLCQLYNLRMFQVTRRSTLIEDKPGSVSNDLQIASRDPAERIYRALFRTKVLAANIAEQ